jgi:hypothetical protein
MKTREITRGVRVACVCCGERQERKMRTSKPADGSFNRFDESLDDLVLGEDGDLELDNDTTGTWLPFRAGARCALFSFFVCSR